MKMELFKALLSCLSGMAVLAAGWFVGGRLSYGWSVRQKRRELQLAALQQFYLAYGEFFAVWKIWNRLEQSQASYDDHRWELMKRAAAAEAIVEGLVVKVSSETLLKPTQVRTLACFRQGFQQLRKSIRQGDVLQWLSSEDTSYVAFKCLAVSTAQILSGDWSDRSVDPAIATAQLLKITSNAWETEWHLHHPAAPMRSGLEPLRQ